MKNELGLWFELEQTMTCITWQTDLNHYIFIFIVFATIKFAHLCQPLHIWSVAMSLTTIIRSYFAAQNESVFELATTN